MNCKDLSSNYEQIDTIANNYINNNHFIRALLLLSAIDKKYVDKIKFIQLVVISLLKQVCLSEDFRKLLLKLNEKNIAEQQKEKEKTPIPKEATPGLVRIEDLDKDFYERFEYWNEYFDIIKNNYIIKPKKVASDGSRRNIRQQEIPFVEKIRRVIDGVEKKTILYSEVEKDNILEFINSHYVKTDQGIIKHEYLDELKKYNEIIDNDETITNNPDAPLSYLLDKCLIYYEDIIKYVYDSFIIDKTLLYLIGFYSNYFGDPSFIDSLISNYGFVNDEQISLIESILFYIDSITTVKEGISMLTNTEEYKPEEIIYLIQKSINNN